jgi:uncharacterized protein YqeY
LPIAVPLVRWKPIKEKAMSDAGDITTRITDQMRQAMKSGDTRRRDVMRMLMAEIKNAELAGGKKLPAEAVAGYGRKLAKGIEEMTAAGAPDRAAALAAELEIVNEFLPKQMSQGELEAAIDALLAAGGYGPKDVGRVMRDLMGAYGQAVDGKLANQLVRAKLQG